MSTKIQWTWPPGRRGETWNPVTGCEIISPGCKNCYAWSQLRRFPSSPSYSPSFLPGEALIKTHPDRLDKPLHWRQPRCIFVNSVSDLFHEQVPFDFVIQVFATMLLSPQHQYIILTKRPERMREFVRRLGARDMDLLIGPLAYAFRGKPVDFKNPLKHVWLGTSIENQYWMEQRGDIMNKIDWPNKLVSFEPLLGPIDPTGYEKTFQWFIIGGESGPGARPMHPHWPSQLWYHLKPYAPGFWKQWGQWVPAQKRNPDEAIGARRIHYNPKSTKALGLDDRWMVRERSTQVYGGEWTEGRDIHQWPKSMQLEGIHV